MTELIIIKTAEAEKLRSILAKNKVAHEIVCNEIIRDETLTQEEWEKQLAKDYQDWANDPDEWKDANGE